MKLCVTVRLVFFLTLCALTLAGSAQADLFGSKRAALVDTTIVETIIMEWPSSSEWISDMVHQSGATSIEFFYPQGQTKTNWTEMGTIEVTRLTTQINLMSRARVTFLGTQKASPEATWKILFKGDDDDGHRVLIYEIICPSFLTGEGPQIQYWKMVLADTKLFTIQYTFKGKEIPEVKKQEILTALELCYVKTEKKKQEDK